MTSEPPSSLPDGPRWLPALLPVVCLTPNLSSALPIWTYYFRDFSLTYYPVREFVAAEARAGRWAFWNPFLYQGSPILPAFYPVELLHLLWPGPIAISWLLTLHFPLAALAMYALARGLGACRHGAFAAAALYSMAGLSLSSLNVQMFLQALAWAPLLLLTWRNAARDGGRWIAAAALVLAVSISTLAVEFVAQALALAVALALVTRSDRSAVARMALSLVLGVSLAALPIALMLGILLDSPRAGGFVAFEALQRAIHPVMLLQFLIPDLAGSAAEPLRFWWGGRFFPYGSPYFMTLYFSTIGVGLSVAGFSMLPRRLRVAFAVLALLGLWYALGAWGGLASFVAPTLRLFRFPVKAIFAPYLVASLCAGLGLSRLRRGAGWRPVSRTGAVCVLLAATVAGAVHFKSAELAVWLAISPFSQGAMRAIVVPECALTVLFALLLVLLARGVSRELLSPLRACNLLLPLLVVDLWRGGLGLNRQIAPRFFERLPELARHEQGLEGGRFFSFGTPWGPAMAALNQPGAAGLELWGFFLGRQVLDPFLNVLDRVEVAEGPDRHSLIPNPPLLKPWDYQPSQLDRLLPILRNAAVARLISLDTVEHPAVRLRARFPAGPARIYVHVYDVLDPWPRSYVACRAIAAADRNAALAAALGDGFDPRSDVALEAMGSTSCRVGHASRRQISSDEEEYVSEADGDGYLVMRDSWARGWRATVDGQPTAVLRANGRHRAVRVPGGQHRVILRYEPPGLHAGAAISLAALVTLLALDSRTSRAER